MLSKDYYKERINEVESSYNFNNGYQFLYCPWDSIGSHDVACITLNPRCREDKFKRMISDERGNSYEVEEFTTKSPITLQILKLCKFINKKPNQIIMGTICPFRSDDWQSFCKYNKKVKEEGLKIGEDFWQQVLNKKIKLIISLGEPTHKLITRFKKAELEITMTANYQKTSLKRYNAKDGTKIIALPHLSHFKLFSRKESLVQLEKIFNF